MGRRRSSKHTTKRTRSNGGFDFSSLKNPSRNTKTFGALLLISVLFIFFQVRPTHLLVHVKSRTFIGGSSESADDDGLPYFMSVNDVRVAVEENGWTCTKLIKVFLDRIEKYDKKFTNAVVELRPKALIDQDTAKLDGLKKLPRLHCVPVLVKDNIAIKGMVNAAGSLVLEATQPKSTKDADVVKTLKEAGAVILGKANMDEFAFGFRSLSSRGGQTRNAYSLARYPGGSSGGSAVGVTAAYAVLGIGTDSGGSTRVPASFGGLYGIRPTVGVISTKGVVPLTHSRDTVGIIAASAEDISQAMDVAKGSSGSCNLKTRQKFRGGLLRFMFPASDSNGMLSLLNQVISKLESTKTMKLTDIDGELGRQFSYLSKYKSTSLFEFQKDLTTYLSDLNPISLEEILAKTTKLCGKKLSPTECKIITKSLRRKMWKDGKLSKLDRDLYAELIGPFGKQLEKTVRDVLEKSKVDVLIYPTFKKSPSLVSKGKQEYCGNNRLAPAIKWPALTIPIGFSKSGLPIGLEVMGKANTECMLFQVAYQIQKTLQVERKIPDFLL